MNRMEQGIASIPRQTVIRDQPHMLAYITPAEAMLLKQNGGSGLPSHGGVPEFGAVGDFFSAMANDFAIGTGMKDDPGLNDKGAVIGPFSETSYQRRTRETVDRNAREAEYYNSNNDNPPPVQPAQPMYQAPMPASFAPPPMTPISSGQPPPPFSDLLNPTMTDPAVPIVDPELPNNPMPVGPRPANKAYTFQELLGMYQNPYA